jgi:hypothetical protein
MPSRALRHGHRAGNRCAPTVPDEATRGVAFVGLGPVAPFRRWSEGDDELEKEIAFTRASMAWTVDGKAVFSREQTEKVYAYRSIEALNPGVPAGEALATLRRLLDAARAIESDVALAICAALRLRREVAMGVQPTQGVDDVVPAFDRWLLRDVPEPRSGW